MQDTEPTPGKPLREVPLILTINGGSSSIKFAAFTSRSCPERLFGGQIERVGTPDARLTATKDDSSEPEKKPVAGATFADGVQSLVTYLRDRLSASTLVGIGHRIVQGGVRLVEHQLVTDEVVAELRRTQPLDLAHLPSEIALLEAFGQSFPAAPQVACFDTAFHRDLPHVAQLLPIPRRYLDAGVRRFGFHGLSYTYLMGRLTAVAGPQAAGGRVILAHLGSGASMAAVRGGKPIDTTMAFTPTAGLVMGTRPGDLDPGLLVYLLRDQNLSADQMDRFISRQCGLLGVSETSSDMRDLLASRATDPRAADAVELFCYQARKHLAALAATLGGLDTLVFSGGIGEHAPEVRAGICANLEFLGISLDATQNARGNDVVSTGQSRVIVRIIPTDEEIVMARITHSIVRA